MGPSQRKHKGHWRDFHTYQENDESFVSKTLNPTFRNVEMIQRTCKNRCEYLLRLLSFVGWHFWGIMYPPGNGSSISHQTGIRKIIFKQTSVTGDVWVPWRVYNIYIYIIYIYIWYILKKNHQKASRNMERSHTVPCPRHVRTYDSPVAKATLSPKGASMAKAELNLWKTCGWRGRVFRTLGYGERFFEKMWLDGWNVWSWL